MCVCVCVCVCARFVCLGERGRLQTTTPIPPPLPTFPSCPQVRALEDVGPLMTDDGGSLVMRKGTSRYMKRADAEPLIRQGVLDHIVH